MADFQTFENSKRPTAFGLSGRWRSVQRAITRTSDLRSRLPAYDMVRSYKKKGLPDVSDLLRDLNDARKAAAYGDTEIPDLEAESIASQIEDYVNAVAALLSEGNGGE